MSVEPPSTSSVPASRARADLDLTHQLEICSCCYQAAVARNGEPCPESQSSKAISLIAPCGIERVAQDR